jgi:hypothetical protein
MAKRCLCPPLSAAPSFPSFVSYPSGRSLTNSCINAARHTPMTWSRVTSSSSRPMATFSWTVPSKRVHPWLTLATWAFIHASSRYMISWSSMQMRPDVGEYIRRSSAATVDLPDPDPPTMNVVSCAGR